MPVQGFVEITIKDLENILHLQISKLWSLNLLELQTKASARFDSERKAVLKFGNALKVNDIVKFEDETTWQVAEIKEYGRVSLDDLKIGDEYLMYHQRRLQRVVLLQTLVSSKSTYKFKVIGTNETIEISSDSNRNIYNNNAHRNVHTVPEIVKFRLIDSANGSTMAVPPEIELKFEEIAEKEYVLDVSKTNIVFATGKPRASTQHLKCTPEVS